MQLFATGGLLRRAVYLLLEPATLTTAPHLANPLAQTSRRAGVGRLDYALALPLLALIALYQRTLSRVLPPACRFEPSCSHYAKAALQQHRLPRALALTA